MGAGAGVAVLLRVAGLGLTGLCLRGTKEPGAEDAGQGMHITSEFKEQAGQGMDVIELHQLELRGFSEDVIVCRFRIVAVGEIATVCRDSRAYASLV